MYWLLGSSLVMQQKCDCRQRPREEICEHTRRTMVNAHYSKAITTSSKDTINYFDGMVC